MSDQKIPPEIMALMPKGKDAPPSYEPIEIEGPPGAALKLPVLPQNRARTQPKHQTVEDGEIKTHGNIALGTFDDPHKW
jgi:hypothetical protein